MSAGGAVATLWEALALPPADVTALRITGTEPVLPSVFALGTLAGACVGATLLAASGVAGLPAAVEVSMREAAAAFRSERFIRLDGEAIGDPWAPLSGDYRAADGWVRLHCNFDHHRDAACAALGVPADRAAVERAVAERGALDVEEAVIAAGGAAGAMRARDEWRSGSQCAALAGLPVVLLRSTGASPAVPIPAGTVARPLAGVRVLDLTRVIAGPVCGRALAGLGAEVTHVGSSKLPTIPLLDLDTGRGKRQLDLDLRTEDGRAALRSLVTEADVLVQSYRPGALARLGLGPGDLAAIRPGIVAVDVSAYGPGGPWAKRRGFDSLVQMVSGIAREGGRAAGLDGPKPLPAQALDHATGWLAALAAITGLRRRASEGGSWHAEVSLARTAAWLDSLGRVPLDPSTADDSVADLLAETDTPAGRLTHVRMPGRIAGEPLGWRRTG
ncbi:MAG: CoA transferase [Frankiaceae bacterium]